jgi:type III pantothenate kinase
LVALYAANVLYGEGTVLVVDVGTFLTLSILHQQEFIGGYIIPGPQTMMDSYGVGAQLPSKQSWRRSGYFEWSKDTVMAMQNGTTETLIRGVTSIIKEIMTRFPGVLVVGTGGAATSLLTPIHEVVLINPTLVLEGLVSLAQTKDLF